MQSIPECEVLDMGESVQRVGPDRAGVDDHAIGSASAASTTVSAPHEVSVIAEAASEDVCRAVH